MSIITRLLLTILIIITSNTQAIDFASHHFLLTLTSGVSSPPYVNYTATSALPTTYNSSYARYIAMSGYEFNYTTEINFILTVSPFTTQSTVDVLVEVALGSLTRIAYFVVLCKSSTYVWVTQGSYTPSQLNISNSLVDHEFFTFPTPTTISNPSEFQIKPILSSFHLKQTYTANIVSGCNILLQDLISSNNITRLKVGRYGSGTQVWFLKYITIFVKFGEAHEINKITTWFDTQHASLYYHLFYIASFNMGIPATYLGGSFSGYDGNCLVGISSCLVFTSINQTVNRSLMFDIRSDPFSSIVEDFPSGEVYAAYYRVICLSPCSYGYYVDNTYSYLCVECGLVLDNCADCTNSSYCNGCINDQSYLFQVGLSQICFNCSISLPGCVTCSNNTICTSCTNLTHYLAADSQCYLCNQGISNCLECSINSSIPIYSCSLCQIGYFVQNSSSCVPCSFIPNCQLCSNQTYCETCVSNSYGFDGSVCALCDSIFFGCQECTNSQCTACFSQLLLSQSGLSCYCDIGTFVTGFCTQIVGCISVTQIPGGQQVCLECDTTEFYQTPQNGDCVCLNNGSLVNGICHNIVGCLTPQTVNGEVVCQYCNVSAGFNATPGAGNSCECQDKYELQGQVCVQICGDGFVMETTTQCDDGNLIDEDGCSSSCTVETGYLCQNGSSSTPSSCVYRGIPLSVSLKSIKRAEDQDQGIFQFTVFPPLLNINRMNLSNQVTLSCDSTYSVSSITYSGGDLQVKADYTADMEGRNCSLTLTFNYSVIISPAATLSFSAVSQNFELVINQYSSQLATFKTIFKYLSYVGLLLFVLSLPYKMIGVELLSCFQLVYLSYSFYAKPSLLFSSVRSMELVTVLWSLFQDQKDENLLTPFTERVQITPYFLENNVIVIGALLAVSILQIFLGGYLVVKSDESGRRVLKKEEECKERVWTIIKKLYSSFLFPVAAGFFLILSISGLMSYLRLTGESRHFPLTVNSFSLLLVGIVIGAVLFIEFSRRKPGSRSRKRKSSKNQSKRWYIPLFLTKTLLLTLLIQVGILTSFNTIIYILGVFQLFYCVLLIFLRPYKKVLNTIGVLMCQFCSLFVLALPIVHSLIDIEEVNEMLIIFVIQGLLILSALGALIRIFYLFIYFLKKVFSKTEGTAPVQQGEVRRRGTQVQQQDSRQSKYEQFLSPSRKKYHKKKSSRKHIILELEGKQVEENEELTILKEKLMKDLQAKRREQSLLKPL